MKDHHYIEMRNKVAFRDIYDSYWYQLYGYAFNVMRNKEKAEDIVQDIFLDFWNRYDQLDIENPRAYLFKALKFQCAKHLQSSRFTTIQLEKIEYALSLFDEDGSLNFDKRNELLKYIHTTAKNILPDKCFLVFTLRYEEHLSYKEIAEKLDISIKTVDNQLQKAVKLLKTSDFPFDLSLFSILMFSLN